MTFRLVCSQITSTKPIKSLCRNCIQRCNSTDRLHSTDIAYKPNESGWGYTKKFTANYDQIFSSKKSTNATLTDVLGKEETTEKRKKSSK